MSNQFELTAQVRSDIGKGASRRLRRLQDQVPAIVYGGKEDAQNLVLAHRDVIKALKNSAFYSHILTLTVGTKKEKVVLKDLQRHPYKPIIMHMDFLRVNANEKLHMNVPLHFINEAAAPGVLAGGIVSHSAHHVEIVCMPADLPEFLEADMSKLEMNGVLHLSDVKLPKGVETVAHQHGDNPAIASIHMPRIVAEDIEPEVAADEEVTDEAATGEEATPATDTPAAE